MGSQPGKIKDEERITIFKRVPLEEARTQYAHLPIADQNSGVFLQYPTSRNFIVYYSGTYNKLQILAEPYELSGKETGWGDHPQPLAHLLKFELITSNIGLMIGLSKSQYDLLYVSRNT